MKIPAKELNHLKRCLNDFEFYAENHLTIIPKDAPPQKFTLNRAQTIVHNKLSKQKKEKGYVRAIILKARQEGISTYVAGRYFRATNLLPYKKSMVLAHKDKASEALFGIYDRYYANLDAQVKPEKVSNARGRYLELTNGSIVTVETAGDPDAGRSQTIHYLHASEVAMWPRAEQVWNAVEESVPPTGSEIVIESTAKGIGNVFHKMWLQAVDGKSEFIAIFLPWWIHEEYVVKLDEDERQEILNTEDPYERKCMDEGFEYEGEIHKLTPEQLAWRRRKIRAKGGGEKGERDFRQENPATPREAFIVSGANFFDVTALEILEGEAREPIFRGTLVERDTKNGRAIMPQPAERGWLRIWKYPQKDRVYAIGADTAYGAQGRQIAFVEEEYKGGGDFSVAYVYDPQTQEIVAELHGRIAPETFATQLNWLSYYYGAQGPGGVRFPATLAVERNHESGVTVIKKLQKEHRHPALYYSRLLAVRKQGRPTTICGWMTTKATRGPMLDELSEAIAAHRYPDDPVVDAKKVSIPSQEAITELFSFVITYDDRGSPLKAMAQEGAHDDRVLALAITLQVGQTAHVNPNPQLEYVPPDETPDTPTGYTDWGY